MPTPPNPPEPSNPLSLQQLIDRPKSERLREYKYRLAQTTVFGLPVIALAIWGPLLGPRDWQRWSGVLQALLTGWIIYVNLGLLLEPLIRRQLSFDLLVLVAALTLYLWSIAGTAYVLLTAKLLRWSALYWMCVALLAILNAVQRARLSRSSR
jgi:cation transport ATPase